MFFNKHVQKMTGKKETRERKKFQNTQQTLWQKMTLSTHLLNLLAKTILKEEEKQNKKDMVKPKNHAISSIC